MTFDILYLPLVMWGIAVTAIIAGTSLCVALIVGQMFHAGQEPVESELTEGRER